MTVADIIAGMDPAWLVTVTIIRGGGRDRWGNPLPAQTLEAKDCLVAPRSTADPLDFSEVTVDHAVLYQATHTDQDWQPGDMVDIPAGPWPTGKFMVDGTPTQWPMGGWEVGLVRGG